MNAISPKALLRSEMTRRGMSYDALADALAAHGMPHTVPSLKNKISRGQFTAVFLLGALRAIGVDWIQLTNSPKETGR